MPTTELDPGGEALLQATLAAHVPAEVDGERGWAAIASQIDATPNGGMAAGGQPTPVRARPIGMLTPTRRRIRLPRTLTGIAAAVAVAAVLMGTGFGIAYYLSIKGQAIEQNHLYTTVNQRQTDQGVSVVLDRAYADSGSTNILYYIELSPALAARGYTSGSPLTFDLTDQYGDEGGDGTISCHPGSGAVLETCEMDQAPFAVPAGTTQLTVDFAIYRLVLIRGGDHPLQDTLQGAWTFEFTIPYHQRSLGPSSGPYPQPTAPAGRVPREPDGA